MDEQKLKSQFKQDLQESKSFMEPVQQRMDRDYEVYRNYRNTEDVEFKKSDLFEYVETVVPIVTNNRIRGMVRSDYPDYVTHAKGFDDILDNTYDINDWDYKSQEVFKMSLIYRSAFAYTGFDKDYKNGTGKLCIEVKNARWCYVDPSAIHLEDSRFFFEVQPMRKSQVVAMHKDKKKEIEKSSTSNNSLYGSQSSNEGWFKTWINSIRSALTFNNDATKARQAYEYSIMPEMSEEDKFKNVLAYIHYWYRDEEDNWRRSCWVNDTLLEDEENPFWHGQLPYDILSPIVDPLSLLGIPINEQIENMNIHRNDLMNYYLVNAKKQAKPPMLWNTSFGNARDAEKLNREGDGSGIIPITNPDFVPMNAIAEYMQVNQMNPQAASMFEQLGNIIDTTTGVNDSFRGVQQASSGKEVQLQQEASYNRIKTMIDQFELFNKHMAQKIIVNAMQFYTTTRGFRIKGDYTKYDNDQKQLGEQMPFEIKTIQKGMSPEGQPVMDRTEFFMYANPNEWTKLKPDEESEEEGAEGEADKAYRILQMTVEIEAGSSLPQSRLARREEANELYSGGAIDQEALLDAYDWPDREEIIKRMQEAAQQAQQAQAQAAQQQEQAKAQIEQQKIQANMQLEQMKMQMEMQKTQLNNNAKIEQQHLSNKGEIAEQGLQNTGNGLAETLDQIRKQMPEIANLSDDQLIAILTGQNAA